MHNICINMQQKHAKYVENSKNMHTKYANICKIWTQYAKICKKKYAKICTKICKICRSPYFACICTPDFADGALPGPVPARLVLQVQVGRSEAQVTSQVPAAALPVGYVWDNNPIVSVCI